MKLCVDVYYTDDVAIASGIVFDDWSAPEPVSEELFVLDDVQPYEPGQFYKRELPPLVGLIEQLATEPQIVVVDGFVWLDDENSPGLGAHLHDAFNQRIAVIGVAKSRFRESQVAVEVLRGDSTRPLFVTAAGIDQTEAATCIRNMHGEYRMPTLLKLADRLGRDKADEIASDD